MNFTTKYTMDDRNTRDGPTLTVEMIEMQSNEGRAGLRGLFRKFPNLRVRISDGDDNGEYVYQSRDRDDHDWITAPHRMNIPTCLLHAATFFGIVPPGVVTEDVFMGCEHTF